MTTQENVGIVANIPQLLAVLSSSMYTGDTISVALKELAQNGFDACKKQSNAKIELFCNARKHFVQCVDNGIGMSSKTVKDVYLTIGGTLKDNLDVTERSGGFGIAKVQFLVSAASIEVDTWHNGEHTVLNATQMELLEGKATIHSEWGKHPNGTSVTLHYPEKVQKMDGSITTLNYPYWTPTFLSYPNPGYEHVRIFFNGNKVNQTIQEFLGGTIITASWDFPTMAVTAWYRIDSNQHYSVNPIVFSAGLYQFDYYVRVDGIKAQYKLPTVLDIRSKVAAGQEGYPFNNQREGFRPGIQAYVDIISKYLFDIQRCLETEKLRMKYEKLDQLEYFNIERTKLSSDAKGIEYSPSFVQRLADAFAKCSSEYKEAPIVAESRVRIDESMRKLINSAHLKFTNNTDGDYRSGYTLFCAITSAIFDSLEECPDYLKSEKRFPKIVGVDINKEAHGHLLVDGDMAGLFVNPLACHKATSCEGWIADIWDTFTHELAHVYEDYHGEEFCIKQSFLEVEFAASKVRRRFWERFHTIWLEHYNEIAELSKVFVASSEL